MFLRKYRISEKKLKLISPSPLKKQVPRISRIVQPHLLILLKNFSAPSHLNYAL